MSNLELVLNMLAEATTTEISKKKKPKGFDESRVVAKQGGDVAGTARKEIEKRTGETVISRASIIKVTPDIQKKMDKIGELLSKKRK